MAKPNKANKAQSGKKDRRAVLDEMRRDQQRAEKKRTYVIIAACAVVALVIIGLGAYPLITDARTQDRLGAEGLDQIGVGAEQAGCQEIVTEPATGSAEHRPDGEPIFYESSPPASGPHYPGAAPMARKFYTAQDRPELGYLVHNLEHGYNILWYDQTIAEDDELLAQVKAIANKFPGASDPTNKFIAAPWTEEDGEPFPDGKHVALTHWSMGGTNGNDDGQLGIWRYCDAPSGEAVAEFVEDYPFTDSPEPNAA